MFNLIRKKMRGITLMETLLSLTIGGLIIVSSVNGVVTYNNSVKVQAAAVLLNRLRDAADLYAQDHYDTLVANAPQTLPPSVLDPYLGASITMDPFRAEYLLSTRTYTYTTPDPVTGGTTTQDALQVMVMARRNGSGTAAQQVNQLDTDPSVRINIANTAGAGAGYVSEFDNLCFDGANNPMPAGSICGAYGSFALPTGTFGGQGSRARYAVVVTKGDSSVYGDQLYRYNFGDPELNTMHTALNMDGNTITGATRIDDTELMDMTGTRARIQNNDGELSLRADGNLFIGAGANNIILSGTTNSDTPVITSPSRRVQIGVGNNDLLVGDWSTDVASGRRHDAPNQTKATMASIGTGNIYAGNVTSEEAKFSQVNSLHQNIEDPLRLQKFQRGSVIVGERARYRPDRGLASGTSVYELSDGELTAGVVKTQDIVCADCGGNLSQILPRWRHMGTYFVPDSSSYRVNMPNCSVTRREDYPRVNAATSKGAYGDELSYIDSANDNRYTPKIILLPKLIARHNDNKARGGFNAELWAVARNGYWQVQTNRSTSEDYVKMEAFAMTYCVFTGGTDNQTSITNSTGTVYPTRQNAEGATWTRIE